MRHRPSLLITALTASTLSIPAPAGAAVETSPYFTEHLEQVLGVDDFDFDSGWIPSSSPIQVRLTAHAGNTIYIGMDGDAYYDWELGAVSFEGLPDGGLMEMDLGLSTSAQVQFNIAGIQWTGDLLDPILYGVFEELVFDPYLLLNHPDRPAILDAEMPRQEGVDIPLGIDLLVASGHIAIDIGGHIHAELSGSFIDVWDTAAPEAITTITEYQQWGELAAVSREDVMVAMAQLGVHLDVDITFKLYPGVVLTVLGTDYTLAEIEVPIQLPRVDQDYVFDPVELTFDPPPPPEETGDDDDSAGDDDDDDGAGVGGDGGSVAVKACDCSMDAARPTPGVAALGLAGLGLLGIRRRR